MRLQMKPRNISILLDAAPKHDDGSPMKVFLYLCLPMLAGCGTADISADVGKIPGDALWVDVRSPREYASSHIPAAVNLPYDEIREGHPLLQPDEIARTQTLLLYCRSGRRSGIARKRLESLGYPVIDVGGFRSAKRMAEALRQRQKTAPDSPSDQSS